MVELLVLGNSLAVAGHNVIATSAARRAAATTVVFVSAIASLVVLLTSAALSAGPLRTSDLAWGAAAGVIGGAALPVAYKSMALGPVAVSVPITVMSSTLLLVGVGATRTGLAPITVVGLTFCLVGVALVSRRGTSSGPVGRTALLAVIAGAGFGSFALCLSQVSVGGGLWPLVAARLMVLLVALLLVARRVRHAAWEIRRPGVATRGLACGGLDAVANLLLLAALPLASLATIGVIASTSPVLASVLAWRFLDERLRAPQWAALLLTFVGLVLVVLA